MTSDRGITPRSLSSPYVLTDSWLLLASFSPTTHMTGVFAFSAFLISLPILSPADSGDWQYWFPGDCDRAPAQIPFVTASVHIGSAACMPCHDTQCGALLCHVISCCAVLYCVHVHMLWCDVVQVWYSVGCMSQCVMVQDEQQQLSTAASAGRTTSTHQNQAAL